jgi:hypothetical protein
MISKLVRSKPAVGAVLIAVVLLVASFAGPAFGAPSPLSIAKKALKTAKKANTRSTRALSRANLALSQAGKPGPQGKPGLQGKPGTNGTNGFGELAYRSNTAGYSNLDTDTLAATCPAGTFATGGDAYAVDTATGNTDHPEVVTAQFLASTGPPAPNAYAADVHDVAAGDVDVTVDVACANATVTSPPLRVRRVR